MLEEIKFNDTLYALIIRKDYNNDKSKFFTDPSLQFQLGFIKYSKGNSIQAHKHLKQNRQISLTPEFLFLKKGKMKINFFSDEKKLLGSTVLNQYDCVLLYEGAHSFDMLEDMELLELKQGPFIEGKDKIKW